jgi:hypothetical protein
MLDLCQLEMSHDSADSTHEQVVYEANAGRIASRYLENLRGFTKFGALDFATEDASGWRPNCERGSGVGWHVQVDHASGIMSFVQARQVQLAKHFGSDTNYLDC